jgi:hypothetical protein
VAQAYGFYANDCRLFNADVAKRWWRVIDSEVATRFWNLSNAPRKLAEFSPIPTDFRPR